MPAKMPAQRVCAPAEVATPVRDSEPPAGSAPKKPPARLPTPWAVKSPDMLLRLPSGFGTAAEIPAACASATRATATPPTSSSGIDGEVRNGQRRKGIRDRRDVADGLDVDARDGDDRGHDDQGEQDRERLQRLDEVEHRPHRDGASRDRDGVGCHEADVRECVDELANRVVALRFIAGGVVDARPR